MNERLMQFRIGMFVIVAGLVLTMLVVWFGESPTLFRDQVYIIAHFIEAPGLAEGIPVRKSGIRIGEVSSIRFDDREKLKGTVIELSESQVVVDLGADGKGVVPADQYDGKPPAIGTVVEVIINQRGEKGQAHVLCRPDGVLVTLTLERKFKLHAGTIPRVSRALIGDVAIDMLPGSGTGPMTVGNNTSTAPVIEGIVSADPAAVLAAATSAFKNVQGTLAAIEQAAKGLSATAKKVENVDEMIISFRDAGKKVGVVADDIDKFIKDNEADFKPALANAKEVIEKFNRTFDEKAQGDLKASVQQLAAGTARFDKILAQVEPVAQDLGGDPNRTPTTNIGQVLLRFNRIAYDLSKLSGALVDSKGQLNSKGTLQRLVLEADLYENFNQLATSANVVLKNLNRFAEQIARDPSMIARGALRQ